MYRVAPWMASSSRRPVGTGTPVDGVGAGWGIGSATRTFAGCRTSLHTAHSTRAKNTYSSARSTSLRTSSTWSVMWRSRGGGGAPGHDASKRTLTEPTVMMSPSARRWSATRRSPLTDVPFVEPRSAITKPLPERVIWAWCRLVLLSEMITVQSAKRPIRCLSWFELDAVTRGHHDRAGPLARFGLFEL